MNSKIAGLIVLVGALALLVMCNSAPKYTFEQAFESCKGLLTADRLVNPPTSMTFDECMERYGF